MLKELKYTRPENLLDALGINFKVLTEEERAMKTLLLEEYKKKNKESVSCRKTNKGYEK